MATHYFPRAAVPAAVYGDIYRRLQAVEQRRHEEVAYGLGLALSGSVEYSEPTADEGGYYLVTDEGGAVYRLEIMPLGYVGEGSVSDPHACSCGEQREVEGDLAGLVSCRHAWAALIAHIAALRHSKLEQRRQKAAASRANVALAYAAAARAGYRP